MLNQIKPSQPPPTYFLKIYFISILPSTPRSSKRSLPCFPHQNPAYTFSRPPRMLQAPPTSFVLIWSFERHLSTSLYSLPLSHVTLSQVSSSAPCSKAPSPYVTPAMREAKFHTHIKLAKLIYVHFNFVFLDRKQEDRYSRSNDSRHSLSWICS